MSDTYTILYDPSVTFYKYALVTPEGIVCNWSSYLDNLSTTKADNHMQSLDHPAYFGYIKLTLPNWVTTEEQLKYLYPEYFI